MKPLNFTAKEVLPALLDKTKVSTIRKAWKDLTNNTTGYNAVEDKPATYKVGDIVDNLIEL